MVEAKTRNSDEVILHVRARAQRRGLGFKKHIALRFSFRKKESIETEVARLSLIGERGAKRQASSTNALIGFSAL